MASWHTYNEHFLCDSKNNGCVSLDKFIFHNNCDNCKGSVGFLFSKRGCDIVGMGVSQPQILFVKGSFPL